MWASLPPLTASVSSPVPPPPYSSRPYKRATNPSALPAPQLLPLLPSISPEHPTTGHQHFDLSVVTKLRFPTAPHPGDPRVSSPDLPSHSPCSRTELPRSGVAEGHAPMKLCAVHAVAHGEPPRARSTALWTQSTKFSLEK
jgi:hypothetical protein